MVREMLAEEIGEIDDQVEPLLHASEHSTLEEAFDTAGRVYLT
jgi:hypothetical protein